jgi:hypothetical protein
MVPVTMHIYFVPPQKVHSHALEEPSGDTTKLETLNRKL